MKRVMLVVLVVAGCKGGGAKKNEKVEPPPTPVADKEPVPPPAPAGPTCAERAARLGKRIEVLAAATPGWMPLIKDLEAPTRNVPQGSGAPHEVQAQHPVDERGVVIAITKDGKVWTQGQELTPKLVPEYFKSLHMQAAEARAMAGGHASDPDGPLYLWADRGAPASAVTAVVTAALAEGVYSPRLLVTASTPVPAADPALLAVPAVKAMADKLPTVEPDATQYLAGVLRSAMNPCSDVITPFATASSEGDTASQTTKLVAELPAGLTKCDCKMTDVDLFEWGVDVWFGATAPGLNWIDLPKMNKGEKRTIGELVK